MANACGAYKRLKKNKILHRRAIHPTLSYKM
jgi:hypothetical protein